MALAQLDAYLASSSYLGSATGVTLEDFKQCSAIKASDVDATSMPHLARWHGHITALIAQGSKFDWKGDPLPAGKAPNLSTAPKTEAAPKKEAASKKEAAPKKEGKKEKEAAPKKDKDASAKKEPAPKKEAKENKKDKKPADEPKKEAEPTAEELAELRKKKMKKVIKEGGKRGVEIEGAADMGGLQFFCTSVDEPEGDTEMLVECMKAMNAESDPTQEERKGGSGHIGKMIFSAGTEHLAICAYVPEAKQGELSCEEWLQTVLSSFSGEMESKAKDVCLGKVKADADKGIFPLKIREPMILEANNFLRKKGLFPEDDGSDDDEMVFGDDDFPS